MPADDLVDGTAHLDITNGNDKHSPSDQNDARPRIQHEMQELQTHQRRPRAPAPRAMRDVTEDFIAATKQLRPGELVQDEYFTLFEAVGALEDTSIVMDMQPPINRFHAFGKGRIDEPQIMDPKMDSGCIPPGDSLEPDFDVGASLTPSQVLWIMDELFRLEMSFHDGYPLSQNLFTSLHIFDLIQPGNTPNSHFQTDDNSADRPADEDCMHQVLWAYCCATLKCVQGVLDTIQGQLYFEEEDFVTHLFGRELIPGVRYHDARKVLVAAMDCLDDSDIEPQLKHAIKYRLVCREYLLFSMDKSHQLWHKLKSKLEATHKDGTNVLASHRELCTPIPDAFSNKVTRQLATSTPPRPMPALSWEEARVKWVQLCDDILGIQKLTSRSIRECPHALQRATWAFAYRSPEPNTFARTKMQDTLCAEDSVANDVPHWDLMLADMRELFMAGDHVGDFESFQVELPSDPRHKVARVVEDFMAKAFSEYLNLYRFACQNRCRLRRLLGQSIGVWSELDNEAKDCDLKTQQITGAVHLTKGKDGETKLFAPISGWTMNYRLQVMQWFLQLGFETDVYLPSEMAMVFVAMILITLQREDLLGWTHTFNSRRLDDAEQKGHRHLIEECQMANTWMRITRFQYHCQLMLTMSLVDLYNMLEHLAIIGRRPKRYEKAGLRFEARMKPFLRGLTDLSIDKIQAIKIKHTGTVRKVCSIIPERLKKARVDLTNLKKVDSIEGKFMGTEEQWMNEIKSLERTCISLGLEVTKLQQICEKHGMADAVEADLSHLIQMEIPAPSKRYHVWWPVPQIREKKIE